MSNQGYKLAVLSGKSRPAYATQEEAEKFYISFRENALKDIEKLKLRYPQYKLDFSTDSLKDIEKLYFFLLDKNLYSKYSIFGLTLKRMEELLSVYYCNVYCLNTKSNWTIEKDVFVPNRYFLAVKFDNNFMTIECSRMTFHYKMKDNKKQQSLYREFKKHENFI